MIAWESVTRLVQPLPIAFDQAILVAVLGLAGQFRQRGDAVVRGTATGMTMGTIMATTTHGHGHGHDHAHHTDHNIRSAFMHVVADALTSVLAIVALAVGRCSARCGWIR